FVSSSRAMARTDAAREARDADDGATTASPAPRGRARVAASATGPWRSYKEILARLAQRLLDAQRPIRILQSVRWPEQVEAQFLKQRARELPQPAYEPELGFDPDEKRRELKELLADIDRE